MQFTNKEGLSMPWFRALTIDNYDSVGDYSITDLIKPPQVYFLNKRHDHEIIVDCTDRIWLMLGTACHNILEQHSDDNSLCEQRFILDVDGCEVSMKPDSAELVPNVSGDLELHDYKITTIYKYKMDVSYEWFWQGNGYAYGLRKKLGINITKIFFEMLMKDWKIKDYFREQKQGYPDMPIKRKEVAVISDKEVETFLKKRVDLFRSCEDLPDNELPPCSIEDRWGKEDYFKVFSIDKKGIRSDRAVPKGGKFLSRADAEAFRLQKIAKLTTAQKKKVSNYVVKYVPGESNRCEYYCPANKFCNQYLTKIKPAF